MSTILEGGFRQNKAKATATEELLVTVITIVYNGAQHLEHTILSVVNQTYKNIEYIIIDGGSTDGTLDILRKYNDQISYWKSEPDKGISDAFNKGISQATGDVIGILNADDWYESEAVARVVAHYEPDSILHGKMQYWHEDGSKGVQARPNLDLLPLEMSLNHPTIFISRSLYEKHGLFDLNYKLTMDYHLLLRFYLAKVKFIYIDQVISNMRFGGASANIDKCYREVLKAKNELLGQNLSHLIYFYWTILRYRISKSFSNTPLSIITKMYRTYLSPIKKQY